MTDQNIDTLNEITKMLIDSHKGYEKAAEVTDDNYALNAEFRRRADERSKLITAFQARVRTLGGEPADEGGTLGALHRAMTEFSSLFRDDEKAALEAIDDGEEKLEETIRDKLNDENFDGETVTLLNQARAHAKDGECFAERASNAA